MPFFPNFLQQGSGDVADRAECAGAAGIGVSVARLASSADTLSPAPVGIHPEWYFMSPFQMLKILGMVNWLPGATGEDRRNAAVHHAAWCCGW